MTLTEWCQTDTAIELCNACKQYATNKVIVWVVILGVALIISNVLWFIYFQVLEYDRLQREGKR